MFGIRRRLFLCHAGIISLTVASLSAPCLARVEVVGDTLYLVGEALLVYDVTDPLSPTEMGAWHLGDSYYPTDLEVVGGYAYVAEGYFGLLIYDVSDPTAPIYAGWYHLNGWASDGRWCTALGPPRVPGV